MLNEIFEPYTLGYPRAALFGFCLALVAYNVLAVAQAALRRVHGQEKVDVVLCYHGVCFWIDIYLWLDTMEQIPINFQQLSTWKREKVYGWRSTDESPRFHRITDR